MPITTFRFTLVVAGAALLLFASPGVSEETKPTTVEPAAPAEPGANPRAEPTADPRVESVRRGVTWLATNQKDDGSWGNRHSYSVTALACLAQLAASDDPFAGEGGASLLRGLRYLLAQQNDGVYGTQGHTWIHGQGFATLALSEALGHSLRRKQQVDLDLAALRTAVQRAAAAISEHQSTSGGWWYTQGDPGRHEGSTTVCAVQALVSARNAGVDVDQEVLDKGFEYLKKCQNPDGGFDYMLGPGTNSMKEGTAAGIATLALMSRFDYSVMVEGTKFLRKIGHGAISKERFPYYGHFYGSMGMRLFGEEMGATKDTAPYIDGLHTDLLSWQDEAGAWPLKGWMKSNGHSTAAYSTAFATLTLAIPETRLTVFHRRPPPLPEREK